MNTGHLRELLDNWKIEAIIKLKNDQSIVKNTEIMIIVSTALNLRGRYGEAVQMAEIARDQSINEKDKKLEGMATEQIGTALWWKGDTIALEKLIKYSLKKLNNFKRDDPINASRWNAMLYIFRAWVNWKHGNLDEAENNASKLMQFYRKIGGQRLHGMTYYVRGVVYLYQGRFDEAIDVLKHSLFISKKIDNLPIILYTKTTLGVVYYNRGELETSLEYFTEALYLYQELGNQHFICYAFDNIGVVYQIQGNFEIASHYLEKAIHLRRELGNDFELAQSLFNIIVNCIKSDSIEAAYTYLDELDEINKRNTNQIITLRTQLAEALILKEKKRMTDKIRAQELLSAIINHDIFNIEITTHAMIAQCELLLWELNITEENEILEEIKELLQNLREKAEAQQSYTLLIEVLILQSKIAIISIEIKQAKTHLEQGKILAEELGLEQLRDKVIAEEKALFRKLNEWKDVAERNATFLDKILETEVIDYLRAVGKISVRNNFPY